MKKRTKIFYCYGLLLFILCLVGCSDNTNAESKASSSENNSAIQPEDDTVDQENEESESTPAAEDTGKGDSKETASEETKSGKSTSTDEKDEDHTLADYSSEKIEYARVWLQLGPNQAIDELYVQRISAGTPLDPEDENSMTYPEDVIQLRGSRLVDGIVTYSGNGDGTINVYNVPLRWYGGMPRPDELDEEVIQKEMVDIIQNTKLVAVEPGNNEEIISIINKMKLQ
ncbi:MAG: hypothetical protein WCF60_00030 [Anaerobacillus sp.]